MKSNSSTSPKHDSCELPDKNPDLINSGIWSGETFAYPTRPAAVSTSTSGSSQSIPREPLRTTVTSRPALAACSEIACATSLAPIDSAAESRGT